MKAPISTIRTLIVDDEVLARENVISLLRDDPEIEVVAQSGNGEHAVAAITEHKPDLLFLDVQMPGMDGLDVLAKLPRSSAPQVVFVTAHDHFALQAFEVQAVDYLLKPFNRERFAMALARAKATVRLQDQATVSRRLDEILNSLGRMKSGPGLAAGTESPMPMEDDRLFIRCDGEIIVVSPDEIHWVESDGDYVRLHMADKARFVRMPLLKMMAKLPRKHFVQIHRSTVINLRYMRKASTAPFGEYNVELTNGRKLKVTRTFVHNLKSHL